MVSRLRYASQVIQIRSQYLHPGDYRPFKVIQGNIITLAHSDEPYIYAEITKRYGKFVKTRFHELEHESKMRLLNSHSYTVERRGYKADKERQEKRAGNEAYICKAQKKRLKKTPPYHLI